MIRGHQGVKGASKQSLPASAFSGSSVSALHQHPSSGSSSRENQDANEFSRLSLQSVCECECVCLCDSRFGLRACVTEGAALFRTTGPQLLPCCRSLSDCRRRESASSASPLYAHVSQAASLAALVLSCSRGKQGSEGREDGIPSVADPITDPIAGTRG